ncbi:MAG: hypothetical protein P8H62_01415 [Henriciella sp.]|nr:hypothetical protein [Henriciella sp.]
MSEVDKKEERRRAAIASILRRRNRSRKPRANSGTSETSWAEYGPVTFTPGSDRSWAQKLGLFVLLVVGLSMLVLLFFTGVTSWLGDIAGWVELREDYSINPPTQGGFVGWVFPIILYAVLTISAIMIALVSIVSLLRIIKNNIKSD